jgi:hypothetical protein
MNLQEVGKSGPPIAAAAEFHRLCTATERGSRALIARFQEGDLFGLRQRGHKLHRRRD